MRGEFHQRKREIRLAVLRRRREIVLTVIRLLKSYQRVAGTNPRTPSGGTVRRLRSDHAE